MNDVKIFLAEGFEEIEAISVIDICRRAGIKIQTVSITNDLIVKGAHGIDVVADEIFDEASFGNTDMIILPGGNPGTDNLQKSEPLCTLITDFFNKNKYIAAICAAPSILGGLSLLNGKHAVCYPGYEGTLKGAVLGSKNVVVDGNIITSKGPGTAIDFALVLVEILKGKDTADKIAHSLIL